jgi:signal transduction histidine kinase
MGQVTVRFPPMTSARPWPIRAPLGSAGLVVLGLVLAGLYTATSDEVPATHTSRGLDAAAAGMLVLAVLALAWARRYPASVTTATLGLSVAWYGAEYTSRLIDVPTIVAFYFLGATGDRLRQVGLGGVVVVGQLVAAATSPDATGILVRGTGWTVAAMLCGELVRNRRLLLDEYAERAVRAEADGRAEAERRVADERMRIARDVHDVLAHTVSLMTVQAGVAADAVGRDQAQVEAALATIRSAGKEAMGEIRATVSVLRGTAPAETAPTPGLDRVAELVETARGQGLDVELDVDPALTTAGGAGGVDAGVGVGGSAPVEGLVALTAYRVVQEGLTNVVRHAGAAHARVAIERGPSGLVVEVTDDGTGGEPAAAGGGAGGSTPGPGPGFGVRGMRERVDAAGGTLEAGPAPGGGWRVRATLPTGAAGGPL